MRNPLESTWRLACVLFFGWLALTVVVALVRAPAYGAQDPGAAETAPVSDAGAQLFPPPTPYWSPADCTHLADLAMTMAQNRDLGIRRDAYRAHIVRINAEADALAVARLLSEFDRIFDPRRGGGLTPVQVANDVLRRCNPPTRRIQKPE